MPRSYDTSKVHNLREVLLERIEGAEDAASAVDSVMEALGEMRVISWDGADHLPLFTSHGRALVAIMERPASSYRELSARLGIGERMVSIVMKDLVTEGLVSRRMGEGKYRYRVEPEGLLEHPEVWRLLLGATDVFYSEESSEESISS